MKAGLFYVLCLATLAVATGDDVSDKVLQWLRSDKGQVLHMLPSHGLDRQAVSLGRLFKRADALGLLRQNSYANDDGAEEDELQLIAKREKMARFLKSSHQLSQLSGNDYEENLRK